VSAIPAEEIVAPRPPAPAVPRSSAAAVAPASGAEQTQEAEDGVVHIVQPGQTLWRIARAYDVPLDTIARMNGISDPTRVDVGMPIFVPGARATIDVVPYPAPFPRAPAAGPSRAEALADFLWPIDGGQFMRPFGERRRHHRHVGVDIRGALGQQILASRDGVVAFSGRTRGGYGTMVILDHGGGVQSLYAHAASVLVKAGDTVARGEPIARVGRTGNATTEHCHFEIRVENHPVDPLPYLRSVAQVAP
jgi:murein DD-endopeptidase MepM/ murein hydrolase activator NlpD